MIVRRVIEKDVNYCAECPYYHIERDMGASIEYCLKLHKDGYNSYLDYAETHKKISEKCPLTKKN